MLPLSPHLFLRRYRRSHVVAQPAVYTVPPLTLTMLVAGATLGPPLVLQMDILGLNVELEALRLEMDILESVSDALLLTMDIVPASIHTSDDVQAPVAQVVLS